MQPDDLDMTFAALTDPTRRAILERLTEGTATVQQLTAPFGLSQPAISKHLKVLEKAGLVERRQKGQTRPCLARTDKLDEALAWMRDLRGLLAARYDRLDNVLDQMKASPNHGKGRSQ